MDIIRSNLGSINVPSESTKIYKDECVFSYDTPESKEGLFICMNTFLGFGAEFVPLHYQRTGYRIFLNVKKIKRQADTGESGDDTTCSAKKITKLAIGIEGGYVSQSADVFDEVNEIVILHWSHVPQYTRIPLPNTELPEKVLQSISGIIAADSASRLDELASCTGTWDGEKRQVSKHAENLKQLENGVKIPPEGWKCEKCDKKDNLWLNLTDGSILCGRKFFDGSGGNNHAVEHYQVHQHPLAVKLGTITFTNDKVNADVYSYAEDDMVEDPYLEKHLSHFGIDVKSLKKTDKSMTELELDYNQRIGEWAIIQESDAELVPIRGPGYTGMVNLGNSCYLNSVIQVIFSIPDFSKHYDDFEIFINAPSDPAQDFCTQMAKLCRGLLKGDYSIPINSSENCIEQLGIKPTMFKNVVGKGHPEFTTKRQQDVQEFFLHLMNFVERDSSQLGLPSPANCFKFRVEERIECNLSHKVSYNTRDEYILPLQIPIHKSTNPKEVEEYENKKNSLESNEKLKQVRHKIPLESCFDALTEPELIDDFFSASLNAKTTAIKSTKLKTFPEYLMLQAKKFTFDSNWTPKKLEISLQVPDVIDLKKYRGKGPQPGEDCLEDTPKTVEPPNIDQNHLIRLRNFGFTLNASQRALYNTNNSGVDKALDWLVENQDNPGLNEPFTEYLNQPKSTFKPDPVALEAIQNMGISKERACQALKETNNSVEAAVEWIFTHEDTPLPNPVEQSSSESSKEIDLKDGLEKYKLVAFISHMGTSTMCGHYVCHIKKDNNWVIFNDNKVAISQNLPKDMGYLYLYKRIQ